MMKFNFNFKKFTRVAVKFIFNQIRACKRNYFMNERIFFFKFIINNR